MPCAITTLVVLHTSIDTSGVMPSVGLGVKQPGAVCQSKCGKVLVEVAVKSSEGFAPGKKVSPFRPTCRRRSCTRTGRTSGLRSLVSYDLGRKLAATLQTSMACPLKVEVS
jgi:hypothetical protein